MPLHRINGGSLGNLRLSAAEATLDPPGISVIQTPSPAEAAQAFRKARPYARRLCAAAATMGSATEEAVRAAGFDFIDASTPNFPEHRRLIHPSGAAGFTDANLAQLSGAFTDTTGH